MLAHRLRKAGEVALGIMGANVFALAVVGFTVVVGRVTDEVIVPGLDGDGVSRQSLLVAVAAVTATARTRSAAVTALSTNIKIQLRSHFQCTFLFSSIFLDYRCGQAKYKT